MPLLTLLSWARWTRSEVLCLLTVGTLLLGPIGAALAVDVLHGLGVGAVPPPSYARGRITGLKPTGEVISGAPVFIIDYEACGRSFSERHSTSASQPLQVGMPAPVILNAVLPGGRRVAIMLDMFGVYNPQLNRTYVTHCTPGRS